VLRLVDAALGDLSVRAGLYIGRRAGAGDGESFVIQTGEAGRHRLRLPELESDASIEEMVAAAQAHLSEVLGVPVPLCPVHGHPLDGIAIDGNVVWECPDGGWRCAVGDYEERTWPQRDVESLSSILSRRLQRRGTFPAVTTIGVRRSDGEQLIADFGVAEITDGLLEVLAEVAAPLPVTTHHWPHRMIRV
jgi:hypothetical protein